MASHLEDLVVICLLCLSADSHSVSVVFSADCTNAVYQCVISSDQKDQSEVIKHGRRCAEAKGIKPADKKAGKVREVVKLGEKEI